MSETNVKIVRSMYEAFGKGDIGSVISCLDRDVEWWEAENFIYADQNPYSGPNAVLEGVFMRIANDWDGFTVSAQDVLDAGDAVVGYGYYSATYKKNGKKVRGQFAHIFHLKNEKVIKFQQYTDTAAFLQAIQD